MSEEKNQCFSCGASSDDRVLLQAEENGEKKWVCVRCLPPLIHGQ